MSATTVTPASTTSTAPVVRARPAASPIPTSRLIKVELRKMFDTRSGFWMLVSIAALSVVATGAVIIFAQDIDIRYQNFATAIGFPMSVILPMIAILGAAGSRRSRSSRAAAG